VSGAVKSEMPEKLSSDEVNVLCAGLIQLLQRSPRRGQDVLVVRCADMRIRHVTKAQIADLVDKLTVFQGAARGTHAFMARELAKETRTYGAWEA